VLNDLTIFHPEAVIGQRSSPFAGKGSFPRLPERFEDRKETLVIRPLRVIDLDYAPLHSVIPEIAVYSNDRSTIMIGQFGYCGVLRILTQGLSRSLCRGNQIHDVARQWLCDRLIKE
jgi:hypothetical protein